MTEEEKQLLKEHADAIAKILYKNAPVEELTSLGKIEEVVRSQMQEHVMPSVGFFIENVTGESTGYKRFVKSIIGIPITSYQAQKLELRPHSQLICEPYFPDSCILFPVSCILKCNIPTLG